MTCPKCGWEQPATALECERCGIVTGRFRAQPRLAPRPAVAAADPASGRSFWFVAAGAGLCAVLWFQMVRPPERAPAPIERLPAPVAVAEAPAPPSSTAPAAPEAVIFEPPPTEAPPPIEAETLPSASCPLETRGYGAPPTRDRVYSDWYTRADSYDYATREHLAAAAPMIVYFFTDWCSYCRALDDDLLSSSPVDRYLRQQVVKMRINPESGAAEKRLADRFGVNGYPALTLLTPDGASRRLSPYAFRTTLLDPDGFVARVEWQMKELGETLARQASADRRAGQFEKAIAAFTLALRVNGGDDQVFLDRGRAYAESGAFDEALDDFARLARARPQDAAPVQGADAVLRARGAWDASIACWTGFIERNPSHARAYLERAQVLEKRGLPRLSRTDAQRACQLGEKAGCARSSSANAAGPLAADAR